MSSKDLQLRGRFLIRFCDTARARLVRTLELLAAGASAHAAAIQLELYSLAGESVFLGYSEVGALARQGEAAARRIPDDPTAVIGCMRAVRALGRALDALDALDAPQVESPALPAAAPPGPAVRGRILVVDDSKLNADLLSDILSDEDFAIETATSGPELERALATFRLDLAISDVNMPDLDCALVCRRVREAAPHARIVLISGLGEAALARECLRVSADGYIARDRGLTAILERINAELAEAVGQRS